MSTYNYAPGAVHLDFHHNNISMSASTITDLVRAFMSDQAEDISSSPASDNRPKNDSSSVSPESNSGSSSPSPDVKTKPSPVTDNPSPVTDTPSTDLNSILDIPEPNKYTQVRKYIKDRCRFDPEFQRLFDESTRVELCSHLTNLFGWFVDPHHLGVNWNRHH